MTFDIWEKQKVKWVTTNLDKGEVNLPEEIVIFLNNTGLPLISTGNGQRFLPFTYLPSIKIKEKDIYLLGDYSRNFTGLSFIGVESINGRICDIDMKEKTYAIVNQSLYQFIQCLGLYNAFFCKYETSQKIVKEIIRDDYQQLQYQLRKTDAKAMSQEDYFWAHLIDAMKVNGYGDYLLDFEPDINIGFTDEELKNEFPF